MGLSARIARLERRSPPSEEACRVAVTLELAADEAAMSAMRDLAQVLGRVPRGPDYLVRLAQDFAADPVLAPRQEVYVAGFLAARERAGAGIMAPQPVDCSP